MAPPKRPRTAKPPTKAPQGLPDRETLIAYLREHGEAGKADLARAFGLKGADRRALREMLKALEAEGALGRRGRKGFAEAGALPPVGVADVAERDADGDLYRAAGQGRRGRARRAAGAGRATRSSPARRGWATGCWCGSRRLEDGELEARLIKRLGQSAHSILGVVRKARREIRVEPVDRALAREPAADRVRGARRCATATWCWPRSAAARPALWPQARQGAGGGRPRGRAARRLADRHPRPRHSDRLFRPPPKPRPRPPSRPPSPAAPTCATCR